MSMHNTVSSIESPATPPPPLRPSLPPPLFTLMIYFVQHKRRQRQADREKLQQEQVGQAKAGAAGEDTAAVRILKLKQK